MSTMIQLLQSEGNEEKGKSIIYTINSENEIKFIIG